MRKLVHFAAALAMSVSAAFSDDHVTNLPFALDWKFEGPAAPYFASIDNGHFAEKGLNVEITAGSGSLNTIPKVATGAFPVGFADINGLIRFLDQNPGAPITAVMMVYDKPPYAIIGRKSLGVETPADLAGKVLGAPPPDAAWAQFPIFAAENNLDMDSITVEPVGFPTREPMLAEGNVAAIAGFSFSSYLNLARLGVDEADITTLLMADYGLDLYGNAIIVNTDFAKANPDVIKGFLEAVAMGWKDAAADPAAVIPSLIERNPAADAALEQRRLELALEANVMTDSVMENGMGGVEAERLASAVEQIKQIYDFQNEPDVNLYFTNEYLPEGLFPVK